MELTNQASIFDPWAYWKVHPRREKIKGKATKDKKTKKGHIRANDGYTHLAVITWQQKAESWLQLALPSLEVKLGASSQPAPTADSAGLADKPGCGWGCPPRWMPPPAQSPAPPHPSAEPPPSWQKEPQLGSLWATYALASAALGVAVQVTDWTMPEKCHPALGEGVVAAIVGDELCHKFSYLQSTGSTHHSICSVSHYVAHPICAPMNYARGNSTCHVPLLAHPVSRGVGVQPWG